MPAGIMAAMRSMADAVRAHVRSSALASRFASPLAVAAAGLLLAAQAHAAPARLRTFCGERQGTAGDALLVDRKGRATLVLAQQGADPRLLDQADDRVGRDPAGETGTQVGQRYCLVARLDAQGRPREIVSGRRAAPAPRKAPRPRN